MVGVFMEDRGPGASIEHDVVVEVTVPEAGRHGNDVAVGDLAMVLAQADKMSVPENLGYVYRQKRPGKAFLRVISNRGAAMGAVSGRAASARRTASSAWRSTPRSSG